MPIENGKVYLRQMLSYFGLHRLSSIKEDQNRFWKQNS